MKRPLVFLCCALLFAVTGCKKNATADRSSNSQASATPANQKSNPTKFDVCGLITKEEIEEIVGSPLKDKKSSESSSEGLRMSQCFYTAAEFTKSVSLAITQSDPGSEAKSSVNEFWKETFGRYDQDRKNNEKESADDKEKKESLKNQERERGEEKEAVPPKKIAGIGNEAFWSGSRVGGALYVLSKQKNAFIRLSVGGADKEEIRIEKSKKLAQKAMDRL
jgi:Protein of unknown function (DUF3558)